MNDNQIIKEIAGIEIPIENYKVFLCEDANCYFGKNAKGNVVFMINSNSPNLLALQQETKSLSLLFNHRCTFVENEVSITRVMHILACKENEVDKIAAFIRLTKAFSFSDVIIDQYYFLKLFSSLSSLFNKQKLASEMELQGLFAELYSIIYCSEKGIEIGSFWQSKDRMKFDFFVNDKKRIEVKSTLKSSRTHRFKHEQLLSELYDIVVISILLQKSDAGISLKDVIDEIRIRHQNNYSILIHIDSIIANIGSELLDHTRYDTAYIERNLKLYKAHNIPHFNEKTPDGVYNAEYDSALDTISPITIDVFKNWMEDNYNV